MPCERARRITITAAAALLLSLATCFAAAPSAPCGDLPSSQLEVYDLRTPSVDEHAVDIDQLDDRKADPSTSRHTLMRTSHDVAMLFEVAHRIVPTKDGLYCDAPTLVRIAIGFPKRSAFLARPAARDACIRASMLEHEADHQRADAGALRRLLDARQEFLVDAVRALKRSAFTSPQAAVEHWKARLQQVSDVVRQDFVAQERAINASVDTPAALSRIENGCGGRLKQIERGAEGQNDI